MCIPQISPLEAGRGQNRRLPSSFAIMQSLSSDELIETSFGIETSLVPQGVHADDSYEIKIKCGLAHAFYGSSAGRRIGRPVGRPTTVML